MENLSNLLGSPLADLEATGKNSQTNLLEQTNALRKISFPENS